MIIQQELGDALCIRNYNVKTDLLLTLNKQLTRSQAKRIIEVMKENGISFDAGLSEAEFEKIEEIFQIKFPFDLRILLSLNLPVSEGFVHWRYGINSKDGKRRIEQSLARPLEGTLFDVKMNSFWMRIWGNIPEDFESQKKLVTKYFSTVPKLIPIYGHRYISEEPNETRNPVFSVYQTDIIYYGKDLIDYLCNEFRLEIPEYFGRVEKPTPIRFWDKMIELNNG